ncbi:MAG: plasmid replication initiator RepA, partial [Rhodobacteraceae bacterium]|nr:plasmid replication initiator RepA [Paracoccaceae bacterium]
KKSGSNSPRRVFRKMIRDMIAADHLPDYQLFEDAGDIIRVVPRNVVLEPSEKPVISAAALEQARALAPEWDIYALESEWVAWWAGSGRQKLRSADGAFLGWVKRRVS